MMAVGGGARLLVGVTVGAASVMVEVVAGVVRGCGLHATLRTAIKNSKKIRSIAWCGLDFTLLILVAYTTNAGKRNQVAFANAKWKTRAYRRQ
jgi:SNF family Na+-dependent transporter